MKTDQEPRHSKMKLALGAASLFLFVVGLKRTFRTEEGREVLGSDEAALPDETGKRKRDRKPEHRRSAK